MTEHYKTIEECPKNKCPFILKSGKHKDLCCSRPAYPKHTFEERKYCRSHYEALTKGIQVEQKHEDEVKFNNEEVNNIHNEVNNIHNEVEDLIPKMKSPIVKEKPKKIEEIVTKPKPKPKETPVIKVEKPKVVKEESEESLYESYESSKSSESSYETSESSEEEIPKQQSFTYKTPKKVNTYDKTKFGEMLQQAKINTLSQSVNISKRGFLSK